MAIMKHAKLVRDRIPEIIRKEGRHPQVRVAESQEYFSKLQEKLQEEVGEFLESKKVEELADILEVVYALAEQNSSSKEELEILRQQKAEKRGAFTKRLVLEEVTE